MYVLIFSEFGVTLRGPEILYLFSREDPPLRNCQQMIKGFANRRGDPPRDHHITSTRR